MMEGLLFLGFVAVISEAVSGEFYSRDKVLRLKPENEQHLQFLRNVSHPEQVDFWKPASAELVTTNSTVDIRVPADWVAELQSELEKIALKFEVLTEDLQILIENQFDQRSTRDIHHNYETYHSWDEIESWTGRIAEENPDLVSRMEIGKTYEGRSIYLLRVGNKTGAEKPAIFMDCGMHAREWISPAFCQWFLKEVVGSYNCMPLITTLFNQLDFLVVPVVNVDGYVYSWTKDRFWRKTRSKNSGSSCVGTDPNRNFDAKWCTTGTSTNPCSAVYCGTHAESEKEVKAVADFIRNHSSIIKAYLTIHSYSQLLLYPYSYDLSLPFDHKELDDLARDAVKKLRSLYDTKYIYGPGGSTIYLASGGSDDWAYDLGIKYSFTFELRDTGVYGFLLPESQIKPTCEETMLAVYHITQYVLDNLY
ncbi:carboxypeptidase B-like isoform X1 [Leucoraja erinacea]|uniref:carboxypeptidase B-like isoform X1 n=2 Tax=Leucoraja erinaceus TaxID=7782 RepID=UPI0024551A3E|nr:carboxypeptidase B-like isoform X1 [Leucoraja erinacea]